MSRDNLQSCRPTSIGGQALIEGVMMKGPKEVAIAVRTPDAGITIKKEPVTGMTQKLGLNKIPFVRGGIALIDSMVLGIKSLTYSAELLEEAGKSENDEPDALERFLKKIFKDKATDVILYISVFFALILSIGIFILGPTFLVAYLKKFVESRLLLNLVEGIVRLSLFVIYVSLISKLEDMRRVFQYHGAEHKAIYCYEHGDELTVENTRKYSTLHPRCGTSFLFIVMMVSMILFSMVGWPNLLVRVVSRLALLPLVAGISYEIIRFAGKSTSPIMAAISYPGMMMQRLTTIEPDDSQIEVAIAALKGVLVENKEDADW